MKKLPEVFVTFPAVFGNTKECEERKENMKEEKAEAKERKIPFPVDGRKLHNTRDWFVADEFCGIRYYRGCCGIRTMEDTSAPGKPDLRRRFGRAETRRRPDIRGYYWIFNPGRLY